MASRANKLLIVAFMFFLLLVQALAEVSFDNVKESREVAAALYKKHHHPKINCHSACSRRCKKASRKKICMRACGTCCRRCQCVPPGTYGNKSVCPCYASLKTHGGKPKCP